MPFAFSLSYFPKFLISSIVTDISNCGLFLFPSLVTVSYTHLDVYKRQEYINAHRDGITLFDDVPSWEWYCGDVAEASNTHGFEKINGAESWK